MALRYPSHKISSMERYVAESTTAVTGGTLALTDRVLVRLALNGNTNFLLENGSEDGQYRILLAESITGTMRLEPDTNVKLKDRAWLPESTGEVLGLIWNATLGQWVEIYRSVTYDSFTGVYVKNNTGSIITKGSVVYINGIDGNNPTITLATNATEAGSNRTLGLVKQDIPINGFGYVISSGVVEGINTIGGTSGSSVYLGTGGAFTATKPVAPAHIVKVGNFLKINASTGSIQVDVSNGWELEELHNVLITSPTNGQVLTYDSTTSLWKNATGGGGGGSPSIGGTITGGTAGSVLFVDPAATIAQDNAQFSYDTTNGTLAVGGTNTTTGATIALDVTKSTPGVSLILGDRALAAPAAANTVLSTITSRGYAGTASTYASRTAIRSIYETTSGGTKLTFLTSPDNSSTLNTRMQISKDGNVGIGLASTTSASQLLEVAGTTYINSGGSLRIRPTSPIGDGNIMFESVAFPGTMDAFMYSDGTNALTIADTNGNAVITATQTSSVILGDVAGNTPDSTLHARKGNAGAVTAQTNTVITAENSTSGFISILTPAANEGGVLFGSPTSNVQGGIVYTHSTDILGLRTGGNTTRLNINGTGNIAIGKGTTAGTSLFNVGATDQFQINSSGNIINLNNVTTNFPSVQGAANTYLKNDGSGNLTWSTVSGGSGLSEPEVMARAAWRMW